jgi:predicted transcriptional regulator of viral defense system
MTTPPAISAAEARKLGKLLGQGEPRIWNARTLAAAIAAHRTALRLPPTVTTDYVVETLIEAKELDQIELKSMSGYQSKRRFTRGRVSPFELALSLKANTYFTHSTAVFLHGLTDRIPKTLFVNAEQSEKPDPTSAPTQVSIDRAFSHSQRSSNYTFSYETYKFVLLSGKHSNRLGVETVRGPQGEALPATSLERTLIDITVRPTYGGGVEQVLEAFIGARDRARPSIMLDYLKRLDYAYPYHQAIGYYLERASYPQASIVPFRKLPQELDFYLAHALPTSERQYVKKWRLHVPRWMEAKS